MIKDNYAEGLDVNASATINNNVISNNGGNGINVTYASPNINSNSITGNNNSFGIWVKGNPLITNNTIDSVKYT
jgi:hypothetical protein